VRIEFDWDPAKAASNAAKHGVSFKDAMTVFAISLRARSWIAITAPTKDAGLRWARHLLAICS
jgi:uncharacterized DUF497 family protein